MRCWILLACTLALTAQDADLPPRAQQLQLEYLTQLGEFETKVEAQRLHLAEQHRTAMVKEAERLQRRGDEAGAQAILAHLATLPGAAGADLIGASQLTNHVDEDEAEAEADQASTGPAAANDDPRFEQAMTDLLTERSPWRYLWYNPEKEGTIAFSADGRCVLRSKTIDGYEAKWHLTGGRLHIPDWFGDHGLDFDPSTISFTGQHTDGRQRRIEPLRP